MEVGTPPAPAPGTPQKANDDLNEPLNFAATTPDNSRLLSRQQYETRLKDVTKALDSEKQAHAKIIKDKDSIIQELEAEIEKLRAAKTCNPVVMKMDNTDIFVSKPRKGAKDVQSTGCAVSTSQSAPGRAQI